MVLSLRSREIRAYEVYSSIVAVIFLFSWDLSIPFLLYRFCDLFVILIFFLFPQRQEILKLTRT